MFKLPLVSINKKRYMSACSLILSAFVMLFLFAPLTSGAQAQSMPNFVEIRLYASANSLTIYVSGGIPGIPIDLSQVTFLYPGGPLSLAAMFHSSNTDTTHIISPTCLRVWFASDDHAKTAQCATIDVNDKIDTNFWYIDPVYQSLTMKNGAQAIQFIDSEGKFRLQCQADKICLFNIAYPPTPTPPPTNTLLPTLTFTSSPTLTMTMSPSATSTATIASSPTLAASITATVPSLTPTLAATLVPTITPSPTFTATPTTLPTFTYTPSPTPSPLPTPIPVVCQNIPGPTNASVSALSWSADDKQVAIVDSQGQLNVGMVTTPSPMTFTKVVIAQGKVISAMWQPLGDLLLIGYDNSDVYLWRNGQTVNGPYNGNPGTLYALAWSPDGKQFATAGPSNGNGGGLRIWIPDAKVGWKLRSPLISSNTVANLAWSSDSSSIAASLTNSVGIWDVSKGNQIAVLKDSAPANANFNSNPPVTSMNWFPYTTSPYHFVTTHDDGSIKLWDITGQKNVILARHIVKPQIVVFSAAAKLAARQQPYIAIGHVGGISIYDIRNQQLISIITGQQIAPTIAKDLTITALTYNSTGALVMGGTDEGNLLLCNMPLKSPQRLGQTTITSLRPQSNAASVTSMSWSQDGKFLATGMKSGYVSIWDFNVNTLSLHELNTFAVSPNSAVSSLKWDNNPTRNYLATGSCNGAIQIWNMGSLQTSPVTPPQLDTEHSPKKQYPSCVTALDFGPNNTSSSNLLVAGNENAAVIHLWELLHGTEIPASLVGTTHPINGLVWNINNRLAIVTKAGALKIADMQNSNNGVIKMPVPYNYNQSDFIGVLWRDSTNRIMVSTSDGLIDVWYFTAGDYASGKRDIIISGTLVSLDCDLNCVYVIGVNGRRVLLWNGTTVEFLASLEVNQLLYTKLTWHPTLNVIALGDELGGVTLQVVDTSQ